MNFQSCITISFNISIGKRKLNSNNIFVTTSKVSSAINVVFVQPVNTARAPQSTLNREAKTTVQEQDR